MSDTTQLSVPRHHHLRMGVAYGITDVGLVRFANEDNFLIDEDLSLIVVADGMGGHDSGAIASADAIKALQRFVHDASCAVTGTDSDRTVPADALAHKMRYTGRRRVGLEKRTTDASSTAFDAVVFANQCLFSHNLARRTPEGQGMGTTVTGLWQLEEGGPLTVFHVGDSRLYRYRTNGLVALTRDQTLYQRAVESGLTVNLPSRNLLWQAVGPYASIEPEIHSYDVLPGDIYLVCSDGLHSAVPHSAIEGVIRSTNHFNLDRTCSELVSLAKAYGGRDNITAVIIQCDL